MKKIVLLLTLCFISCINKSEEEQGFRVILELKIQEDDNFRFFFKSSNDLYSRKNSTIKKVFAEPDYQKIKFITPNLMPFIRLDFGHKTNQVISIKSITFKQRDKKYVLNQEKIHKVFGKNKWTQLVDQANATYKPVIINNTANPKLVLKNKIVEEIISNLKN